jgi:hypothetical protein
MVKVMVSTLAQSRVAARGINLATIAKQTKIIVLPEANLARLDEPPSSRDE